MILRPIAGRYSRSTFASTLRCTKRPYAKAVTDRGGLAEPSAASDGLPIHDYLPQGHPDSPSSILDTSSLPPTTLTRSISDTVSGLVKDISSLRADVNSHIAAFQGGFIPPTASSTQKVSDTLQANTQFPDASQEIALARRHTQRLGSRIRNVYHPMNLIAHPPSSEQLTLPMLLANQTHLGHHASLWHPGNSSYVFGIRDGIHIISLDTTLAYLRRACKIVREVARAGGIILFVGTRKGQRDIIVNTARNARGYHLFDRWIPGTLTNGQQILRIGDIDVLDQNDQPMPEFREQLRAADATVIRPDLVVCMNPLENQVCLHECGMSTIPTIGVIDTDVNPTCVTYPIPANDDSLRSIALIAGALGQSAAEGISMRQRGLKPEMNSGSRNKISRYLAQAKGSSAESRDAQQEEA